MADERRVSEFQLRAAEFSDGDKLVAYYLSALVGAVNRQTDMFQRELRALAKDNGKWQSIQNDSISAGFASVVEAIANSNPLPPPQPKPLEVKFMFVVKNDHAAEPFSIVTGDVTDSEGNIIPDAQVDVEVLSSNEDAVSVTFDPTAKSGEVSFVNAGLASVTAEVSSKGKLLGSGAVDFTVTLGDPAAITSVGINFPGLEEAPPPPEA